ncbi:MAG: serine--tRNA ligase [Desulfobulbaceae bacterium]|jgi:seryl-tRNA synthetase|nr:serine--tRNA ligase [Desulfobulbaceae bacterium]
MLELRFIRENLDLVKEKTARRGADISLLEEFGQVDEHRRQILAEVEGLKNQRNVASKQIAELKRAGNADAEPLIVAMRAAGDRIKELDTELAAIEERLQTIVMAIPNLHDDSTPIGQGEGDNPVVKTWGRPPEFSFTPKAHWELGEATGSLDFERATKVARARFAVLKGFAAKMERALINFMLDLHTEQHGYTEILPPFLVNAASMTATGQLPKFAEDIFKIDGWDLYLTPTAEVPVTNLHRDETLDEKSLPIRYAAYTPCFRSEAGSYGRDTRGLIRQHQFDKVELVKFTTPERSMAELESLLADAEAVLQRLNIHYRVVALCSGDLGFSSAKTYDIEVWLPGQGLYREISSCSNFLDFQTRRGGIRYRPAGEKKSRLAHTLNGSGLAVGRTMVAIFENYQRADGSIAIPEALEPYFRSRLQ